MLVELNEMIEERNTKFKAHLLLILCGLLAAMAASSASGADLKTLPGHVPAAVARLNPLGRLAPTNQMRLAIGVQIRDPAGLDAFLAQLYDPASPNYKHYLTPEEFAGRFGPTEQDYEAVKEFARTNGLTVTATYPNRLVLDVSGPAAAVEKALHITLQTYLHPTEARQFFAPDTEPTVRADLPVADIQGLSDYSKPHPRLKKADIARLVSKDGSAPDGSGSYFANDFRNAYASGTSLTGTGQMVGVLEFDGYYASDISAYASAAGDGRANITIEPVLLDDFNGVPTVGPDSGNGEVSLDIEQAMAMAPGLSKIVVFEAGPNGLQNDILNSMVTYSDFVKQLSCCWGWSGGPNTTTDGIFKEMDAQGQSFFNASGDSDAFTVGANSDNGVDNPESQNAPSSSPYITQVGGTTLNMNGGGGSYAGETVWNWGGGTGSSGGVSSYYSIPSWQTGMSMTANQGSTTMRNIPDVAMTADSVFVYYGDGQSGSFGGTSCAAPLWAGFMALVNQQAASAGNSPAGFINPAIYTVGQGGNATYTYADCFHDITTGNNFWFGSPNNYSAVAGYDLCTGWGTPNGASLINALAGSSGSSGGTTTSGPGLEIVPQTGYAFSGFTGGPFSPAAGTFQLTNVSATALNWSLVSTSSWLSAKFINQTLAAYSATSVSVTLAAAANALKVGSYTTSLGFTNLSKRVAQKIPVTLQVEQAMSVSPLEGFTAAGPVGGPLELGSQTFVISNLSTSAMKWGLAKPISATWLVFSATNGVLPAGGQATVTAGLSASATKLRAAVYKASVNFTNAAGVIATVPFTLSVGQPIVLNGGFETGTFADWTQSGNTEYTSVVRGNPDYVHSGLYGASLGPSSSPGYLSQTVTTIPGENYQLSLWLRNASGQTPNWFQVQWNGTAIFTLSDLASTGWTNLQFIVSAASDSSVLELGFQDDPYYLGLDDISLTAVASTSIKAVVRQADDFRAVWNTIPGAIYQLQYKTNLFQPDWINLGGATTAGTNTMTMTDTNAMHSSSQRFYRLLALPPQ